MLHKGSTLFWHLKGGGEQDRERGLPFLEAAGSGALEGRSDRETHERDIFILARPRPRSTSAQATSTRRSSASAPSRIHGWCA
ncbi:MAG: hypothetical protein ABI948_12060 [Thermoleophilia bacterium]